MALPSWQSLRPFLTSQLLFRGMCISIAFEQTSIFLSRKADCAQCIVLDFEGIMLALISPDVPSLSDADRRDFHGDKECMLLDDCYNTTVFMFSYKTVSDI